MAIIDEADKKILRELLKNNWNMPIHQKMMKF